MAQPKIEMLSADVHLDPSVVTQEVRVDEGCATLFDYCVQVHCSVKNTAATGQQATVNVDFQQGGRTAGHREHVVDLKPGEVAYFDEKFDEAKVLGGASLLGICRPAYRGTLIVCSLRNTGGAGDVEVRAQLIHENGTASDQRTTVHVAPGEQKEVPILFADLDGIRGECAAGPAIARKEPTPSTSKLDGVHCYGVQNTIIKVEVSGDKVTMTEAVMNSDAIGPIYEGTLSGETVHVVEQTDLENDVASGTVKRTSHKVDQNWHLTPDVLQSSGAAGGPMKCPPGFGSP